MSFPRRSLTSFIKDACSFARVEKTVSLHVGGEMGAIGSPDQAL